jgi:hypothetical protein
MGDKTNNTATITTLHPRSEHWLDELDFGPGDWDECSAAEQEFLDREGAAMAAHAEANWERDTLAETAEWRAEIEEETGQRFTDADWLEFVTDELVSRAEAAAEDARWRAGC